MELVDDPALLEEVSGLVEWPQVLMGSFEEDYLAIPSEIIRLTIKTNQKCFVTRPSGSETLSNKFVLISNIVVILGLPVQAQLIIKGVIIISAAALFVRGQRRAT